MEDEGRMEIDAEDGRQEMDRVRQDCFVMNCVANQIFSYLQMKLGIRLFWLGRKR